MMWPENKSDRHSKMVWKHLEKKEAKKTPRAYMYLHLSDDIYTAERISFHISLSCIHPRSGIFSLLYT